MALSQTSQFCSSCNTTTIHQRGRFSVGWGVALTMITGGVFLPIWVLIAVVDSGRPYKCVSCSVTIDPYASAAQAAATAAADKVKRGPFPDQAMRPGPRACPTCSAVMPHTARFCRECGTALAADLASA